MDTTSVNMPRTLPTGPFELLDPGSAPGTLILVKGYLTGPAPAGIHVRADDALWVAAFRAAAWRGAIVKFVWDAGHGLDILGGLAKGLRAALKGPEPANPLTRGALGLGVALKNSLTHWSAAVARADTAGHILAARGFPANLSSPLILAGHSLGARIVYQYIAVGRNRDALHHAILLGGAADRGRRAGWERVMEGFPGTLINIHNADDAVLRYLFPIGQALTETPCGLSPIGVTHERLRNLDAKGLMPGGFAGHACYHDAIPALLAEVLGGSKDLKDLKDL